MASRGRASTSLAVSGRAWDCPAAPRVLGPVSMRARRHEPDEIVSESTSPQARTISSCGPFNDPQGAITGSHHTSRAPRSRSWCILNAQCRWWVGAERIHGGRACNARARWVTPFCWGARGHYFSSICSDRERAPRDALLARRVGHGASPAICVNRMLRGYVFTRAWPSLNHNFARAQSKMLHRADQSH